MCKNNSSCIMKLLRVWMYPNYLAIHLLEVSIEGSLFSSTVAVEPNPSFAV